MIPSKLTDGDRLLFDPRSENVGQPAIELNPNVRDSLDAAGSLQFSLALLAMLCYIRNRFEAHTPDCRSKGLTEKTM
jgi:hypothetical protein